MATPFSFGTTTPQLLGATPTPAPTTDPMQLLIMQLIQQMSAPQQQGPDLEALSAIMRPPDTQGERNRGYMPGVNNEFSPFSNGFFGGKAGREASAEKEYGPSMGFMGLSPTQQGLALAQPVPNTAPTLPTAQPFMPSTSPLPFQIPGQPDFSADPNADYDRMLAEKLAFYQPGGYKGAKPKSKKSSMPMFGSR